MAVSCLPMVNLLVSGVTPDASTNFVTDAQAISKSYEWSMKFIKAGTDGDPILTIEVSNDNVNWCNPYFELDGVTPLTFTLTDTITTAFDEILPYRYVRVTADANGTTTGTVEIQFVIVSDT